MFVFIPFVVFSQNWTQIDKIVASDRADYESFGSAVKIYGDYAIVGCYQDDHDVDGENDLINSGSAFIFYNNSGDWILQQKLVAPERSEYQSFGVSVDIYGNYAIVGANGDRTDEENLNQHDFAGAAYIYYLNGSEWEFLQKIVASDRDADDRFGISVAITENYAVVGATMEDSDENSENILINSGSCYIFENNANTFSEVKKIVATDRSDYDNFGNAVAIDDESIVVAAYHDAEDENGENQLTNSGSVYIYKLSGNEWIFDQKITAFERSEHDFFGSSLDIYENKIVVGAYLEDDDSDELFPISDAGSVYIYQYQSDNWIGIQKVVSSERSMMEYFGYSVGLSAEKMVVGALGKSGFQGTAYVFNNNNDIFEFEQIVNSNDLLGHVDYYGNSVSVWEDLVLVGAPMNDTDENLLHEYIDAGAAYLFTLSGSEILFGKTKIANIYPNPASDMLIVEYDNEIKEIVMYDVAGKKVFVANPYNNNYIVNVSGFNAGIYLMKIIVDDSVVKTKIIID